jgi:NADH-quinone oxidoreductase subunit J
LTPVTAYILYGLFALGGVGLYLALPRPEGGKPRVGGAIALCAVVGLLVLLAMRYMVPHWTNGFFYLFGGLAVLAAGRVVTHPRPVYSAVYFGVVVLCVAVILVMQQAQFLAVALVLIYAGAILVTYAFVIMLAQQSAPVAPDLKSREPLLVILVSFVVMGAVAGQADRLPKVSPEPPPNTTILAAAPDETTPPSENPAMMGNTLALGRDLFGPFIVTVELSGVLLLVAMIGAIAIARKRVPLEEPGPPPPPLGEIGRHVPPF